MREFVKLVCPGETNRNCGSMYTTTKNKKTMQKKLELKKFCKFCRKHTLHKESK